MLRKHSRAEAVLVLATALSFPAWADNTTAEHVRGSDDDAYAWSLGDLLLDVGGRVQVDGVYADSDARDIGARTGLRRAGINISAKWRDALAMSAAASFDEDGAALTGLSLGYNGDGVRLRAGKFGGLVGMERRASSGDTFFMERALATALTSRAAWGAAAAYSKDNVSAELAYFTDWHEQDVGTRGSDGRGFAARVSWHGELTDGLDLHVGVSGERRTPDKDIYRIRVRPEAELIDARLLDTSRLRDVRVRRTFGLEGALGAGALQLQAEYLSSTLERPSGDATLRGAYVQAGWMLTGESRRYRRRSAALGGIEPASDFGAVELVARYSTLDLDDQGVAGGNGTAISAGANWFVSRHLCLVLDFGRAQGEPNRDGRNERIDFVQARAQLEL